MGSGGAAADIDDDTMAPGLEKIRLGFRFSAYVVLGRWHLACSSGPWLSSTGLLRKMLGLKIGPA